MTLNEAFGVVIWGLALAGFASWYGWCWFTMLFRCQRPSHFFSQAYSTSGLFFTVNILLTICIAAFGLYWATN